MNAFGENVKKANFWHLIPGLRIFSKIQAMSLFYLIDTSYKISEKTNELSLRCLIKVN